MFAPTVADLVRAWTATILPDSPHYRRAHHLAPVKSGGFHEMGRGFRSARSSSIGTFSEGDKWGVMLSADGYQDWYIGLGLSFFVIVVVVIIVATILALAARIADKAGTAIGGVDTRPRADDEPRRRRRQGQRLRGADPAHGAGLRKAAVGK